MRLGHSCSPAAWPSGKKVVASLDHCGVKAKIADVNVGQRQARAVKAALTALLPYPGRCDVKVGARGT